MNNAGLAQYAPIADMSDAYFEQTLDHYLRVPFKLAQAAIPQMREQGAGWIVNIGSVTAQRPFKPYDDFARYGGATVYAAIKAALNRFTQGLAAELENDDIAVNLVAPSTAISTPGADLPAKERTGLLAHSLHYARHAKLACRLLDGGEALPIAEIPDYAHPEVMAAGE